MKQDTRHKNLIKAWLDGAKIQYLHTVGVTNVWRDCSENNPEWLEGVKYRIKPEPKLVPFTFDDHADLLGYKVKAKSYRSNGLSIIIRVTDTHVSVGSIHYTYQQLLDLFEFINGNPCGKEVLV